MRLLLNSAVCSLLLLVAASDTLFAQSDPKVIVARVGGQEITQREIDDTILPQTFSLQQQLYTLRKVALDNLIIHKVLENEARRKGVKVEELKQQMMAGPVAVLQAQVDDLYQQNASAFGLMSPDEAKEKLRLDLEGQIRLKRYRDAVSQLRKTAQIDWLLEEPRLAIAKPVNLAASLGSAGASVVITEFSDFQCPYCKEVQPVLKKILEEYSGQIRLDFKNLPLPTHPLASEAAQAVYCGGKQNAFWRYHDALFAIDTINAEKLNEIAVQLGLQLERFKECMSSSESRTAVAADVQQAMSLGVNGTPSFLINGKMFRGVISLEELRTVIDRELKLAQTNSHNQSSQPSPLLPQKDPMK